MKKIIGFVLILLGITLMGPRPEMSEPKPNPSIPNTAQLDHYLMESEKKFSLIEGTEKTIVWAKQPGQKTKFSINYLHGFSATRRDLHPVVENVAKRLGANLFLSRLNGHGGADLGQAKAIDWLHDAEEAYQIGRKIGDQTIVMGISTGATLVTWLASRHKDLRALVLLSPNFAPRDGNAQLLIGPWGRQLAQLVLGKERSWQPSSQEHARFWTHRYSVEALVQMMLLVDHVDQLDLSQITHPLQIIYTEKDTVVSVEKIRSKFQEFGSSQKKLETPKASTRHELAGDILQPKANAEIEELISTFLLAIP